jgi:hypothetical protein
MTKVSEALAQQKKKDVDMDAAETCPLTEFKEHHRNTHHEGGTSGNGEDDEEEEGEGRGGQQVRCAQ